jgi:hypothetical protein
MKWSDTEELFLGRTLELLVVLINIYKNRYGIDLILVSMVGGCSEGYNWNWLGHSSNGPKPGQ